MFVYTVVIAGDGAGADIAAAADFGVADIGQVVGLAAVPNRAVFHFDEIADVRFVADVCLRAQASVGADAGVAADAAVFQMRKRLDHAAGADDSVFDHAVGADAHTVAQFVVAFDHHVYVDFHVLPVFQAAAQIKARRIAQGQAGFEQCLGLVALENALQRGQLLFVVYARRQIRRGHLHRMHGDALGVGQRDQVGQVILALGVVAVELRQPA